MRKFIIKGREFWLLSFPELAKASQVDRITLGKWEVKGWLPKTPIRRTQKVSKNLRTKSGWVAKDDQETEVRFYTQKMARVLRIWVDRVRGNKKRTDPTEADIKRLHDEWEIAVNELLHEIDNIPLDVKAICTKTFLEALKMLDYYVNRCKDEVEQQALLYECFMAATNRYLGDLNSAKRGESNGKQVKGSGESSNGDGQQAGRKQGVSGSTGISGNASSSTTTGSEKEEGFEYDEFDNITDET